MSRYTPEELADMAAQALAARDSGDPLWQVLVVMLAARFLCHPKHVEARIEQLATGAQP